jgi:hypothetical protein
MIYTVTYKPSAEGELVDLWINVVHRQPITDAANRIDALLRSAPHEQGESRDHQTRILFERPLAIQFEIRDDDCLVEVLKVWWIGR